MTWLRTAICLLAIASFSLAAEPWPRHTIDNSSRGADGVKLADFNGDGLADIVTGWEEGGVTRLYVHPGHARSAKPWPPVVVGKTPNVEDAVPVDLDRDGSLDVVSCCEGRTRSMFVHWGPKDRGKLLASEAWQSEAIPESVGRMMWMFCEPMQVDGKRGVDLVAAGKGDGAKIGWFESPEDPRNLAAWKWHAMDDVGWVMSIKIRDVDGDGDADVLLSDRKRSRRGVRWLENPGPGQEQTGRWRNHNLGGQDREVMFLTVADLDGDGKDGVVCAVKDGPILLLQSEADTGSWTTREIAMPEGYGSGKGVAVGDLDQDGKPELVFSCEHADGALSGVGRMVFPDGVGHGKTAIEDVSGSEGIKYDRLELIDVDGDGDLDILGCEERQPIAGRPEGLGVFWYENRLVPCR